MDEVVEEVAFNIAVLGAVVKPLPLLSSLLEGQIYSSYRVTNH